MKRRKFAIVAGLAVGLGLMAGRAAADMNYWYTIAVAASHNETASVQQMLTDPTTDPDVRDGESGRTALDYAASFNNLDMAKLLLDHGAHIDWRDNLGNSALHWAAERGNVAIMRFLIERGATVDFPNTQGITPLMVAAEHGQPAAVRLLLASGADPKKQDFTGRDALGWAEGQPAAMQALNSRR